MSNAASTIPAATKAAKGNLFLNQNIPLSPKDDGTERSMGVLHIEDEAGNVLRVTDFSKQHLALTEGESVKVVYEETQQMKDGRPVTYRNLQTAVQN